MKLKLYKTLLLALLLVPVASWGQAEYSQYYIEGDYAMHQGVNGTIYYTLTNIETKGITIGLGPANMLHGGVSEDESVVFSFDTIENHCPDGYSNILFWKQKEGDGPIKWQIDSEVRQPRQEKRTDMVKIVMLVLDCSNSLGSDFSRLKKSAKRFIDILSRSSSNGNIRIGVIGFSNEANTDRNVIPIQTLTKESAKSIKKSIDQLSQHNNTAMYYAMDKGETLIRDYVNALDITQDQKFGGAVMVTFTDGFDNHSLKQGRIFRKGLQNPYFQYVRDTVIRHTYTYVHHDVRQADGSVRDVVEEHPLENMMLVLRGSDVSESDEIYKAVFNALASPDKPFYVNNFAEVERKFNEIAAMIVSKFEVLNCYVPRAHEGRVRWTFDKPHGFFGISAGGAAELASGNRLLFGGGGGIDFAFPTKDFRARGGFVNYKAVYFADGGALVNHVQAGVLTAGTMFQYKRAPLLGVGFDLRIPYADYYHDVHYYNTDRKTQGCVEQLGAGLLVRAGIISQKHLYCYADLAMGVYQRDWYHMIAGDGDYGLVRNYSTKESGYNMYFTLGLNLGFKF